MEPRALLFTPAGGLRTPWRLAVFGAAWIVASFLVTVLIAPFGISFVGLSGMTAADSIEVVGALVATWATLRFVDRKPLSEVGLESRAARPALIASGFVLGGAAIALPILLLIALGWLRYTRVMLPPPGHPLIMVTAMLLPAALVEELFMRGYLLTVLRDAWNWPVAVLVTSIAFGLLHLKNPGVDAQSVILVMLAGVFLATVRIATGSLYAAWAAHFAWNWVMAVVFHAAVSGLTFDAPVYRYVDAGPGWATGGVWGPEGGIFAGLGMLGGTGLLLLRRRRRAKGDSIDG